MPKIFDFDSDPYLSMAKHSTNFNKVKGDLFNYIQPNTCIAHVVNCIGKWGHGFVVPMGEKFPEAKKAYLMDYQNYGLGLVQFVRIKNLSVHAANMFGQYDIWNKKKMVDGEEITIPPIQYPALEQCLLEVNSYCLTNKLQLYIPKIGAGLAGGDWYRICQLLQRTITVTTYYFELQK